METYIELCESDIDSIQIGETLYRKGTLKPYFPITVEGIEKGNQKKSTLSSTFAKKIDKADSKEVGTIKQLLESLGVQDIKTEIYSGF